MNPFQFIKKKRIEIVAKDVLPEISNPVTPSGPGRLELGSLTWQFINNWALLLINKARMENDSDLNELQTAKIRGRLSVLKEILRMPFPENVDLVARYSDDDFEGYRHPED